MIKCGIYKIQNKINGKCYIGQSINIYKRWQEHKSNSINKNHEDSYYPLYCAIRKYGIDNFDFSIIEECNQEELNNKEIYWVKYYNSFENGYNQTLGGNTNPLLYKISNEDLLNLIEDLKKENLSNNFIANKYNISEPYLHLINIGKARKLDNIEYPIRFCINKTSYEESLLIKKDLQDNILTYEELSKKYNKSIDSLRSINSGRSFNDKKLKYPLRPYSQINLTEEEANEVLDLLINSNLTYEEISELYNKSVSELKRINVGKYYHKDYINYPIRPVPWHKLTKEQVLEVKNLLKNSNLSFKEIANKYGVTNDSITSINRGISYHENNISYPIRMK